MRKLHFGCGPRVLKGWTNIDIKYQAWEPYEDYYGEFYSSKMRGTRSDFLEFDVTDKPLPFENNSVDIIFHEDFIEHLDQRECILFLAETFRVMKPGSVHRINTPDLIWSQSTMGDLTTGFGGVYQKEWLAWGHENLLTRDYLKNIAEMIGYEVYFQSRDKSICLEIPKEFRPASDRDDTGNIFADLVKPIGDIQKMKKISKKVLNVGGGNKKFPLPSYYNGWEHILLDLDLSGNPDLHMDAMDMLELEPNQFDAVYCSNNLEHYYRADVKEVLKGMHHVLKDDGFIEIMVPNIEELIKLAYERSVERHGNFPF